MTSLPSEGPKRLQHIANVVNAYKICLRLEESLQANADKPELARNLIYVRILGYLIHHVPTDEGLKNVVEEIGSCKDDVQRLLDVGKMYYDYLIKPFKANKDRVPIPASPSPRPSFNKVEEMTNATLVENPQSHLEGKKNIGLALIRDGFRCMVTRIYDARTLWSNREPNEIAISDPSATTTLTKCVHIFPQSTSPSIDLDPDEDPYAASIWTIMDYFGYKNLLAELNGLKIHRLENVMTLGGSLYAFFDELLIWFSATKEPHRYEVEGISPLDLRGYPEYVTFTTSDPVKLPLPDPRYLAIHAACAKVAHMSGAAAYIDKFNEDMENRRTLDPNGASAEMLEHAISALQISGYEVAPCKYT